LKLIASAWVRGQSAFTDLAKGAFKTFALGKVKRHSIFSAGSDNF